MFFLVVAIWVLLRDSSALGKPRYRSAVWLGVAFAGVALIKISDIFGVAVTVLFYCIRVLRRKHNFWRELGAFLGGVAVLAVPVFAYLLATNSVGAMWREYILSNFSHIAGSEELGFFATRWQLITRWDSYATLSLLPIGLALVAAAAGSSPAGINRISARLAGRECRRMCRCWRRLRLRPPMCRQPAMVNT